MRRRRAVAAGGGAFFAGEVIRILRLHDLDYDQLHRLFKIVRGAPRAADEQGAWRRFTFADLASLKVAAALVGARSRQTRRLRLKQLAEVCRHLREEFGIEHPLLHTKLRAVGGTIVVQLEGKYFDATATQRVFDDVIQSVAAYDEERGVRTAPSSHPRTHRATSRPTVTAQIFEAAAMKLGRPR
jgi:hypothetical protein